MSDSARFHALRFLQGATNDQVRARVAEIDAWLAKPLVNHEFEDTRLRHKHYTERKVLQAHLDGRDPELEFVW